MEQVLWDKVQSMVEVEAEAVTVYAQNVVIQKHMCEASLVQGLSVLSAKHQ